MNNHNSSDDNILNVLYKPGGKPHQINLSDTDQNEQILKVIKKNKRKGKRYAVYFLVGIDPRRTVSEILYEMAENDYNLYCPAEDSNKRNRTLSSNRVPSASSSSLTRPNNSAPIIVIGNSNSSSTQEQPQNVSNYSVNAENSAVGPYPVVINPGAPLLATTTVLRNRLQQLNNLVSSNNNNNNFSPSIYNIYAAVGSDNAVGPNAIRMAVQLSEQGEQQLTKETIMELCQDQPEAMKFILADLLADMNPELAVSLIESSAPPVRNYQDAHAFIAEKASQWKQEKLLEKMLEKMAQNLKEHVQKTIETNQAPILSMLSELVSEKQEDKESSVSKINEQMKFNGKEENCSSIFDSVCDEPNFADKKVK